MSNVIELTKETFDSTIATGITLVDFWGPWCAPCKQQAPIIDELSDDVVMEGLAVKIAKLDVEQANDLVRSIGLRSVPSIIIYKDGVPVKTMVGVQQKQKLMQELKGIQN